MNVVLFARTSQARRALSPDEEDLLRTLGRLLATGRDGLPPPRYAGLTGGEVVWLDDLWSRSPCPTVPSRTITAPIPDCVLP